MYVLPLPLSTRVYVPLYSGKPVTVTVVAVNINVAFPLLFVNFFPTRAAGNCVSPVLGGVGLSSLVARCRSPLPQIPPPEGGRRNLSFRSAQQSERNRVSCSWFVPLCRRFPMGHQPVVINSPKRGIKKTGKPPCGGLPVFFQ